MGEWQGQEGGKSELDHVGNTQGLSWLKFKPWHSHILVGASWTHN